MKKLFTKLIMIIVGIFFMKNVMPSAIEISFKDLDHQKQEELFNSEVIIPAMNDTIRYMNQLQIEYAQKLKEGTATPPTFKWGGSSDYLEFGGGTYWVTNKKGDFTRQIDSKVSNKVNSFLRNAGPYGRKIAASKIQENIDQFVQKYSVDSNLLEQLKFNNDFLVVARKHIDLSQAPKLTASLTEQSKAVATQQTQPTGWWESIKQSISNFFSPKTPSFEKSPSLWEKFQEKRKLYTPQIRSRFAQKWQQIKQDAQKLPTKEYLPNPQQKDSWEKAYNRQKFFGMD